MQPSRPIVPTNLSIGSSNAEPVADSWAKQAVIPENTFRNVFPETRSFISLEGSTSDLCIVGSGLSGSMILVNVLNSLVDQAKVTNDFRKRNIIVLDQDAEFGSGLAYGSRVGTGALLITSLRDFLHAKDPAPVVSFLNERREEWVNLLEKDSVSSQWVQKHRREILSGDIEPLYFPRILVGAYARKLLATTILSSEETGVASLSLHQGAVNKISQKSDLFTLEAKSGNQTAHISSKLVILACGVPPPEDLFAGQHADHYVHDIYIPSIKETLNAITKAADRWQPQPINLLVSGSNAASLDAAISH